MLSDFSFIFKKRLRLPVFQPKYDRNSLMMLLNSYLGEMKMKECRTKFFCTSINYVDGRSHFFKSWEDEDGEIKLYTTLLRSSAAPLYFGKIVDETNKAVWGDGGCGDMNNPSMEAFIEAKRQKWLFCEPVHLLSLGCGETSHKIPYTKCKKFNNIREISYFMNVTNGGLARTQLSKTFDTWLNLEAEQNNLFTYQRIQKYDLHENMNKIDNIEHMQDFVEIGKELSNEIDYSSLK